MGSRLGLPCQVVSQVFDLDVQDVSIDKYDSTEGDILRRFAHRAIDCQMIKKTLDFGRSHGFWMPGVVEQNVLPDPVQVGFLGLQSVVPRA